MPRSRNLVRAFALVAGIAVLVVGGRHLGGELPRFTAWVEGLGPWGPVAFIVGYVVAAVAFVPGSVLTLAAGAIFGLVRGALYVFIGATLGAAAAFLVSRYVARGWVERRVTDDPRFAAIDRALEGQGFRVVLLLRLSPLFPFNLMNYALGLTRVRFTDYLLGSVGMIPGTVLYVYYGQVAGDVARAAGGAAPDRGVGYYAVLGLGLAATVAVSALVARTARRALKEATQ